MKIKTGDTVRVRTGKDVGKQGVVVRAFPKTDRVLVDGVQITKKHIKSSGRAKGQTVMRSVPIHVSNVALIEGSSIGRVSFSVKDGKKIRVVKGKLGK